MGWEQTRGKEENVSLSQDGKYRAGPPVQCDHRDPGVYAMWANTGQCAPVWYQPEGPAPECVTAGAGRGSRLLS